MSRRLLGTEGNAGNIRHAFPRRYLKRLATRTGEVGVLKGRPHVYADIVLGAVLWVDNLHVAGVAIWDAEAVAAPEGVADALVAVEVRPVVGAVERPFGIVLDVAEVIGVAVQRVLDEIRGFFACAVTV